MNESASTPDLDDELLTQFQEEYETAADRAGLLQQWCVRQARLVRQLRARAQVIDALERARPQIDEAMPTQLGEFQIVRRLGVSMGEVFEAWQPSLKRRVAIKTIRRGRISPQARSRFLREQHVLAGLHQTHIVPIFAAGEEAGLQYFVMPYIDGAALHHVVHTARLLSTSASTATTLSLKEIAQRVADDQKADGPAAGNTADYSSGSNDEELQVDSPGLGAAGKNAGLTMAPQYFRSVAEVLADAADALQHAHDAKIIHRDLKPSNFMVDRLGHCWIIDFGLAAVLQEKSDAGAAQGDASTMANAPDDPACAASGVLGTPPYMAPEQWRGQADYRTDIYGLGVTLYELLTLTRAFAGEDRVQLKARILTVEPPAPRVVAPVIPADLDAICKRAMHKQSGQRYESPRQFAEDLRRWLRGEPTLARPAWWPRRVGLWARRNKGWATALLLVTLALPLAAAALGMIQERNREAERQSLLRQAQARRLNFRGLGWSKDAWELLGRAARIRVDESLRNEAASALLGLDVARAKEFDHEGACSLAFHPSGKKLILGAQPLGNNARAPKKPSQPIRIWDQETDEVKETRLYGIGPVAYDRQARPIALTLKDNDTGLVLWDLDKEQPLRELALPAGGKKPSKVREWVLASQGAVAAASLAWDDDHARIIVWDAETGKIVRQIEQKQNHVIALSPDGAWLALGDKDGQIQICSLKAQQGDLTWSAGRLPITALAFGINPRRAPREAAWLLATGNQGGTIVLWDLADRSMRAALPGSSHDVLSLEFNPDGTLLASAGRGQPRLWNVATGQLFLELPPLDFVSTLAFAPDGLRLAAANARSPFYGLAVRVFRMENGRGLQTLHGLSGQIEYVEFSKDTSLVAALSHQWEIGVWESKTGRLRHVFQPNPGLWADNASLALSDDNQTLAFSTGQQAYLWDLGSAKEQRVALPPGMVDRLAFHGGLGKFLSCRVETADGAQWPLASKSDFRKAPRVVRVRALTAQGLQDVGAIRDFNRGIIAASLARNGSVLVVEGYADDQQGRTRIARLYSLPDLKETWRDASTTAFTGGATVFPMDPEGKFFYWNALTDTGHWVRPRLVDTKSGRETAWPPAPICLSPDSNLTLTRNNGYIVGAAAGVSLHRRAQTFPLATFASDLSANHAAQFGRQGTHFAWGTTSGAVVLCDISAVQARLAEMGLGW